MCEIICIQVNAVMLKCLHSWRDYCTSKRMLKMKIECVQTKLKHATLLKCLIQWSNEVCVSVCAYVYIIHIYITTRKYLNSVSSTK